MIWVTGHGKNVVRVYDCSKSPNDMIWPFINLIITGSIAKFRLTRRFYRNQNANFLALVLGMLQYARSHTQRNRLRLVTAHTIHRGCMGLLVVKDMEIFLLFSPLAFSRRRQVRVLGASVSLLYRRLAFCRIELENSQRTK